MNKIVILLICTLSTISFGQIKTNFSSEYESIISSRFDSKELGIVGTTSDYLFCANSKKGILKLQKIKTSDMSLFHSIEVPLFDSKDQKYDPTPSFFQAIQTSDNLIVFSVQDKVNSPYQGLIARMFDFNLKQIGKSVEVAKMKKFRSEITGNFIIKLSRDSSKIVISDVSFDPAKPQPVTVVLLDKFLKKLHETTFDLQLNETDYKKILLTDFMVSNKGNISFLVKPDKPTKIDHPYYTKLVTVVPEENGKIYYTDVKFAENQLVNESLYFDNLNIMHCLGSYYATKPIKKNNDNAVEGIVLFKIDPNSYQITKTSSKILDYSTYCKRCNYEEIKDVNGEKDERKHLKLMDVLQQKDGSSILLIEKNFDFLAGSLSSGNVNLLNVRNEVLIFKLSPEGELMDYLCFPKKQRTYYGTTGSFKAISKKDTVFFLVNDSQENIDSSFNRYHTLTFDSPGMFVFAVSDDNKIKRIPVKYSAEEGTYLIINIDFSTKNGKDTFYPYYEKYKNIVKNSTVKDFNIHRVGYVKLE